MATAIEKKRAPTVFLTLTGTARDAILEMDTSELNADDGLTKLYLMLDDLFKEVSNQAALVAHDNFEKYTRPTDMSITVYLNKFERMTAKLKVYKIILPEPVLAYRVLRSATVK